MLLTESSKFVSRRNKWRLFPDEGDEEAARVLVVRVEAHAAMELELPPLLLNT